MPTAMALLAALFAMIAAYEMMPVATSVRNRQFDVIRGAATVEENRVLPLWRVILLPLNPVIDKILPAALRDSVRQKLYWANFAGSWLGWNEIEFWALSLAVAAAAGVFLIQTPLVAVIGAFIAALMPFVLLRNADRKVERALMRELPDALYLIASMVSVGIVLPDALRRLAENASSLGSRSGGAQHGVFAGWISVALARSHGGALVEAIRAEAELSGQPRLIALATKLELIETRGAAGSVDLLRALADDQAREYRQEAERRAKGIGSELTFPILLCFFFPYLFVVAAPLFANILQLFAAPR